MEQSKSEENRARGRREVWGRGEVPVGVDGVVGDVAPPPSSSPVFLDFFENGQIAQPKVYLVFDRASCFIVWALVAPGLVAPPGDLGTFSCSVCIPVIFSDARIRLQRYVLFSGLSRFTILAFPSTQACRDRAVSLVLTRSWLKCFSSHYIKHSLKCHYFSRQS